MLSVLGRFSYLRISVLLFTLLILAFSPAYAAETNDIREAPIQARIVGGQNASSGEYPFMVALVRSYNDSAYIGKFCGGILVSERHVMTAAHCVYYWSPRSIDIVANTHDLNDSAEYDRISVEEIHIHPDFSISDFGNDIAILELEEVVPNAQPLSIIRAAEKLALEAGDGVTVIGWGATSMYGSSPSTLQEVELELVDFEVCREAYGADVTRSMLCAAAPNFDGDACYGDSGGPMLWRDESGQWSSLGIVSFGRGCAQQGYPGVYTSTLDFSAWVASIIEGFNIEAEGMPNVMFPDEPLSVNISLTGDDLYIDGVDLLTAGNVLDAVSEYECESLAFNETRCDINVQFLPQAGSGLVSLDIRGLSESIDTFYSLSVEPLTPIEIHLPDEPELQEAFDGVTFYGEGDAVWYYDVSMGALRSGDISHYEQSTLYVRNTGATHIEFESSTDSESYWDDLSAYTGQTLLFTQSGDSRFRDRGPFQLEENLIQFTYSKDGSVNRGLDAAFIRSVRFYLDTDSDGIENHEDPDDDNDGVDDEYDVFPTDPEESLDNDADGIGNNADHDDDNDGVEDKEDVFPFDGTETSDHDRDGIGDNADSDDDNDGVSDEVDAFPFDEEESLDTDGDSIGNNADTDDDNDQFEDVNDAFPLDVNEWIDTDSDGIGNNADEDDDGDGYADASDAFPLNAKEWLDTDNDQIGNNIDADDDGDGVRDERDAFPLDVNEYLDTDGDGIGNNTDLDDDADGVADLLDAFPLDAHERVDTDNDGIGNNRDLDDDNDGAVDWVDVFPLNPDEYLDTDGDGIGNNRDGDDDGDGFSDTNDHFPLLDSEWRDFDGDGIGNNVDIDDDGDGSPDTLDQYPLDPTEYLDSDNDGVGDNADAFPFDSSESVDSDGDGVGDNADLFPDDETETQDMDGDGIGDNADDKDDNASNDDGVDSSDARVGQTENNISSSGSGGSSSVLMLVGLLLLLRVRFSRGQP